jgi:hypothetical protein
MSDRSQWNRLGRKARLAVLVCGLSLAPCCLASGDDKAAGQKGQAVAKAVSAKATFLRREGPDIGSPWKVVEEKEPLKSGDLLLGLPGGVIESANGAVHLNTLADLSGLSPFPIIEDAVVLRDPAPNIDLEFTLDRGRVDLTNNKKQGPAHVRVHVRDTSWDLVLADPGSAIALEIYGRWPRGVPFSKEPSPKNVPTADLVFLVLKGHVTLKYKQHEYALKAPPGPALMEWDSLSGMDETPQNLDKLPAWAGDSAGNSPNAQMKQAALAHFRQLLMTKPIGEVLDDLLKSDNPTDRRLAIVGMGATDDLERLAKAMREAKHPDVWENGVLAFRHWIGRGPGQDQILYHGLLQRRSYTPVQVETILQLLHSYGDADLARPEIYQTLIDYLSHDVLPIRGLAYWHLVRLAPAGQEFGFNPLDPKDKREAAIQKWRKLIPPGKVPSRTTAGASK